MTKITKTVLLALLLLLPAACAGGAVNSAANAVVSQGETVSDVATAVTTQSTPESVADAIVVEYDEEDLAVAVEEAGMTVITLAGDRIEVAGRGATVDGTIITISAGGSYRVGGVLADGQIRVDTQDEETVTLVLDGIDITYTTGAPIYVANATKTVITLVEGTENFVADGETYQFAEPSTDEPNAAIFSHDDLTINGGGSLTVTAHYNNGLAGKDDLKITGGTITVNAVNDGIKGRDSLVVLDGTITVNADADGLQANNDVDAEKGYILIEGGTLKITAGLDGIQAETRLQVNAGTVDVLAGGGSNDATDSGAVSAKGLKAGVDLTITGGTVRVDAADDALHANGTLVVSGGEITLATADDGVHADESLVVNGGTLTITRSYEGLESGIIVLNDGIVRITAGDDGANISTGTGGDTGRMGGPGENLSGDYYLEINGGYLYVDAGGDGLDANGLGTLNDGVVVIYGPTLTMNGTLDVGGGLIVNGGLLVGAGSATMVQAPSTASTQHAVVQLLPSTQPAGTLVHVEAEDGEEIATFAPTQPYQMLVISSPKLAEGTTYQVYTGGSASGSPVDGLYTDAVYTSGTQVASFTISGIVTGQDVDMDGFRGGGPGSRPQRP